MMIVRSARILAHGSKSPSSFSSLELTLREAMFAKAQSLLQNSTLMYEVPNNDGKLFVVHSRREPKKPHVVDASSRDGKVSCPCLNNETYKVCAHAIAVSRRVGSEQKFSSWHFKHYK